MNVPHLFHQTPVQRGWRRALGRLLRPLVLRAPVAPPPSVVAAEPPRRPAVIDEVLDPDGGVRLVRVAGHASYRTIDELDALTSSLPPHTLLHLDLLDAEITSERVMRDFERWADRLECSLVRVRMVGVDPNHPALKHRH